MNRYKLKRSFGKFKKGQIINLPDYTEKPTALSKRFWKAVEASGRNSEDGPYMMNGLDYEIIEKPECPCCRKRY